MTSISVRSQQPSWNFPQSWNEAQELAKKAGETRSPDDTATLDGHQGNLFRDIVAVAQFAGSGLLYQRRGSQAKKIVKDHPPLAHAPIVKMQDPLILAPGWSTLPEKFDALVDHLLEGGLNGKRAVYLKDGGSFVDKLCTQPTTIQPDDKVFVTVFDTPLDAPDVSAPQLAQAVAAVQGADPNRKVDVLGYSMGGLSTRKMLDDGSVKVDQVALLGVANKGTRFARLAEYIIKRDIKWAMSLGGLTVADLPAMNWLKTLDPQKPETNPKLHALNEGVERQLSNANEFLSIAADGFGTLNKTWGGFAPGDGLVAGADAKLDGVPTQKLDGKGTKLHGYLPSDPDVFHTLTDYFNWERQT